MNDDHTGVDEDRRRFHRFPFEAAGRLQTAEGTLRCELVDISLNGALIELEKHWNVKPGARARLEMLLMVDRTGETMAIEMEIEVMRIDGPRVGCRWLVVDEDSFLWLKGLVERNLGDPALLDRELARLDYWPGAVH